MLLYSVVKKKMTIGKNKGQTMYQAQRNPSGKLTLSAVEEQIVEATSLSRGDVRNAIASLAAIVNRSLLAGVSVDLGDLGSFKVEANGKMVATEKEVTASSIKKPQIRYYPKHTMRQSAQQVPISVLHKDGSVISSTSGSSPSPSRPDTEGQGEYL